MKVFKKAAFLALAALMAQAGALDSAHALGKRRVKPVPHPNPTPSPTHTPSPSPSPSPSQLPQPVRVGNISVCSFNIQFLGSFENRDDAALAQLVKKHGCEVVVIQELVAAPHENYLSLNLFEAFHNFPGTPAKIPEDSLGYNFKAYPYTDATKAEIIRPESKSTRFFDAMKAAGYSDFVLSPDNTGPTTNHVNSSANEWWLTFFLPEKLEIASDLPHGFVSQPLAKNPELDRVPYAVPFRTKDKGFDFVLISVHLRPGAGTADKARRAQELGAIQKWVTDQSATSGERDFVVLGDMNIENKKELDAIPFWTSLNSDCVPTNTNPKPTSAKPYDHVMVDRRHTTTSEIPAVGNFKVINLIDELKGAWDARRPNTPYPGGVRDATGAVTGYVHDIFRTEYSDHHPVQFQITVPEKDDDL